MEAKPPGYKDKHVAGSPSVIASTAQHSPAFCPCFLMAAVLHIE